jgi:multiple sugar transport system permease protein
MLNTDQSFTLPLILAAALQVTSLGSTDWGMLQAGVTVAIVPSVVVYLLLQRYYVSGLLSGAIK